MLTRLVVENFLCFGERASLKLDRAPVVLLLGENAVGKSSLWKALAGLRNLVLGGSRPGQPLPLSPHLLAPLGPTRIELCVLHDGVLFEYGMAATAQAIQEEWLRTIADGKNAAPMPLFHRQTSAGKTTVEFGNFSSTDQKRLDLVVYGTRPEELFLREGLRRGVREFAPLGVWFRDRLQMILPEAKIAGLGARAIREPDFAAFLSELLRAADTGVDAVTLTREPVADDFFESADEQHELLTALTRFPDAFAETPEGDLIAEKSRMALERVRMHFPLTGAPGRHVALPPSGLSEGTLRLLHLASILYRGPAETLANAPVCFVDDLTRSLSPAWVRAVLERFAQRGAQGAQFIATIHDKALLESSPALAAPAQLLEKGAGGSTIRPYCS